MKSKFPALLISALLPLTAQAQVQAVRSYDVFDSVGVNTHWYYGGSGNDYQYLVQFSKLIEIMKEAQVYHFRDGEFAQGYNTPAWITSMYAQLAAAGMKADLIVQSGQTLAQMETGLKAYPGVEAIEPPNEYDGTGYGWSTNMAAMLPNVRQAGTDLGLTVLGPSYTQPGSFSALGNVRQYMDYDNMHPYTSGRNPETTGWGGGVDALGNGWGSIQWNIDMVHEYGPGLAAWATEMGYQTTSTPTQFQVPETVAGTYIPRQVMYYFKNGVKRTYFYELIDDPSWAQPGYGLLHYDMSPKPAWTGLTNLLKILKDDNTQFTPEALNYTLTGNMKGVETFLMEKSDGTFYLAVWLNASIYDINALTPTPVAPHTLTLTVPGGSATNVYSFNPDGSVTAAAANQQTYTVNANSCLTLVAIQYGQRPVAATPTFSLAGGSYTGAQSVTIGDATPGATIYYTTDGSTPTTNSKVYSGAIQVSASETIEAMATAPGYATSAAASSSYTIVVAATPDYSVSVTPGALTLQAGAAGTATLTINTQNGFDAPIALACSGLPAGATCNFSPATLTPSGTGTTTVKMAVNTATIARGTGEMIPGAVMAVAFCLFGWRKRYSLQLVVIAVGVMGLGMMTGCANTSMSRAQVSSPASTSTVTVTATAGTLQRSATFSMTVQ